uniref:CUB-like domain-containing protein n=1 Tax=Acrobeloides nanus TaxID=290746 RepID=A0A914C503_9BILA
MKKNWVFLIFFVVVSMVLADRKHGNGQDVQGDNIACECSSSNITLTESTQTVVLYPTTDFTYCQNKSCSWTISVSVSEMVLQILPIYRLANNSVDNLLIKTKNGRVIMNGTNTVDIGSSDASYYSTDAELYVYFTAGTQQELNNYFGWSINFSLIHVPQIIINLTNNSPASLLTLSDFQPNTIYNILVENGTLDFFLAATFFEDLNQFYFPYVDVFQGTTGLYWNNYLGSLSTIIAQPGSPFDGQSNAQLKPMSLGYPLTIFRKSNVDFDTVDFENWMLFRIRESHAMNCPDFNNVFKINSRMAIDYSAKSTGNCILTFLCFTGDVGHPLDLCKLSFSDIKYTVSFKGDSLYS